MGLSDSIRFRNFKNGIDRGKLTQKSINQNLLAYIELQSSQIEQLTKVVNEQNKTIKMQYGLIVQLRDGVDSGFKQLTEFVNTQILPKLDKLDISDDGK